MANEEESFFSCDEEQEQEFVLRISADEKSSESLEQREDVVCQEPVEMQRRKKFNKNLGLKT